MSNWMHKRKNEPVEKELARCEQGDPLWHHEPHEWFIERESQSDVEIEGNRAIRTKVEIVDWFWCTGHLR